MNIPSDNSASEHIDREAADWVVRTERGLSAAEQDDFLHWLVADRRHGAAVAKHKQNWQRLDQLGAWRPEHSAQPNRDLLAPRPRALLPRWQSARSWLLPLAAAAAFVGGGFFFWSRPVQPLKAAPEATEIATIEKRTLEDGSVIELNRGSEIAVLYTATERRVELMRGEAHFTVEKNKQRPFIVTAGGVSVRAVGTAFNVQLATGAVNVLVTEGVVGVERVSRYALQPPEAKPLHLGAGERTSVSLTETAATPQVAATTPEQAERILAWQPRLLDFTATPLMGVVTEFNRHNAPLHLVVADPVLAGTEVSATLRSDNIEGFIRLLEAGFGVRAEREGDTIRLRKAR